MKIDQYTYLSIDLSIYLSIYLSGSLHTCTRLCMQSFSPCVAAALAATEAYIFVARDWIVSVSSPPQFSVFWPQYSALPPASLRAINPIVRCARSAHAFAAAYSVSSCIENARKNSTQNSFNSLSRRSLCSQPEPLATAAAAAAAVRGGVCGAHRTRSPPSTSSPPLKGSNLVMLLFDASLHVHQVKQPEGTPPACTRHAHKGAARLSDGAARTAAATCAEVRAEL